jgi:hypothetical protein
MFTFPLEVLGLTLAAIEVRYPQAAKLITHVVAFQDRHTTLESFALRWRNSGGFSLSSFRMRIAILAVVITISVAVSLSIMLSLIIVGITVFLMIRLTNRWVPERSVGTLGIIIAGFGVLGEGYQFTALMLV